MKASSGLKKNVLNAEAKRTACKVAAYKKRRQKKEVTFDVKYVSLKAYWRDGESSSEKTVKVYWLQFL